MNVATLFEATLKAFALDNDTLKALGLEGEYVVDGPVASHNWDEDGELMERDGVWKGMDTFNSMGKHVDWEHQYRKNLEPKFLIGKGVKTYRDDDTTPRLTSKLFKGNPYAEQAYDLLLKGGELGYSIEAKATARDAKNPKRITGLKIYRVTLATSPMGHDSRVQPINTVLKSLDSGMGEMVYKGWLEESRVDDAISTMEEANVSLPPIHLIQNILINKSYTTGAHIVGLSDGEDASFGASPMRRQSMVSDHIVQPTVDWRKPPKKVKSAMEGMLAKGVDPQFAQKLLSRGYEEDQIIVVWNKLQPLRRA